jgi:UDP-glucose 4-epimerase
LSDRRGAGAAGAITLVTGGAGFIGSELTAQLAAEGRAARVLDDLATGRRENLAPLLEPAVESAGATVAGRVELLVGDVRDETTLRLALDGVDEVYHLACLGLRRSLGHPEESHDVNATGTLRLLAAARRAGVRRFVHVSSSEVYGDPLAAAAPGSGVGGGRLRASDALAIDEDHPTRPTTAYGAAKLAGEAYARAWHRVYGLPVVIVRPFNAYGPRSHHEGDAGEVVPRFLVRALAGEPLVVFGDGLQTRDFTHVRDVARGLRLAAACDVAVGQTLNLGSGREVEVLELARLVRELCGRPELPIVHAQPRPGDLRRLRADSRRAQRLLGWEPSVGWRDGLRELAASLARQDRSPPEMVLEQRCSEEGGAAACNWFLAR